MSGQDRAGRSRSGPATMRAFGPRSTEFDGAGVLDGIRALNLQYMRSRAGRGWLVPRHMAGDLLAWMESRGYQVEVSP